MDAGVEMTGSERRVAGTALDFPNMSSISSPQKLPRRLRRRLLESNKNPSPTVEEIEAKLKEAEQRRQQFYEFLSSKARQKPRSSWPALQEEDLGLRLEARFNAAEQKRSCILAKVQKRLARLDELRKAAKSGVETRFEKERDELGMKLESRVQQAETNRMLLLKAYRQQRDAKKQRAAQSLLQRLTQEIKYKECVRDAIYQKRVAAEKKRLGLLEAEKSRARERVLRVRQVAKSVFSQRETERRRLKEQLESRLQRAKRLRAVYLKQRGGLHDSPCRNLNAMVDQAEILSRKLARCWRQFVRLRGTTLALTKAHVALEISEKSAKLMPFEQLAVQIESATTLQTVKALLNRFENRITLKREAPDTNILFSLENIDHLLKRVASPNQRCNINNARGRGMKRGGSTREACSPIKLSRYPVRLVLCAYMILGHPDEVFRGKGEHEIAVAEAAESFIREFELLIKITLDGPNRTTKEETISTSSSLLSFRSQLEAFDRAWCSYLYQFVVWKVKDAKLLEEDLITAACQLELSMMHTCKLTPEGDNAGLSHYMRAIHIQVPEDQKLLREKVYNLSGNAGLEHMERALSATRSRFLEANEIASSIASPNGHKASPSSPGLSDGSIVCARDKISSLAEGCDMSGSIVQPFSKIDDSSSSNNIDSSNSGSSSGGNWSSGAKLATENEVLANEIVHEHAVGLADGLGINYEEQEGIKAIVRETMERAFWDGIMETMKQDEPDCDWVLKLMKEVQNELCEMSPSSWRQEIVETINVDILSQEMNSGIFNMDYFGKILEFVLAILQKLSAPASEDEMKPTHRKLLKELGEILQAGDKSNASIAVLMITGLRFVLQQIQVLKKEISKARIRILEPFIKGPAGLEYLRKAFTNRYGSPTNAPSSLPLTLHWLSSVHLESEQEWGEYLDSLSALTTSDTKCSLNLPPTTLRTGGSILKESKIGATTSIATGLEAPECKGDKVDLLLRLGLLKLVSEVEGLTMETLPETLRLNLDRLRAVQSQLQKIIVFSTSILVLRQMLLIENLVTTPESMENMVSESIKRLSNLLDSEEDVGISGIVETLCGLSVEGDDNQKVRSRKEVITNTLAKSLRDGDAVFTRVSRAVYLAARGVVLGGSAVKGRQLAEGALRCIGTAFLTERLVEAVKVLVVVATVSANVHRAWYEHVI
ncbi:hypothetical protein U1Q18_036920 [Sarracenia purpurea var. burkii]